MVIRRLLAAVAALGVMAAGTVPAAGQQETAALIEVGAVTPWVDDGGTFAVDLLVANAPLDSSVVMSIGQPFEGTENEIRADLLGSFGGDLPTDPLRDPIVTPLADLLSVGSAQVRLETTVRSTSSGRGDLFIPRPGVHPVQIALVDRDDAVLDARLVYLNHLPPTDDYTPRLSVAVAAQATAAPLFDEEGRVRDLDSARTEASLLARISQIMGFRDLGVSIDPQILVALALSDNPNDASLVAVLAPLMSESELLASTWVPIDTEAWAETGRSRTVSASLKEGSDAIRAHLGVEVTPSIWPADPRLGPLSPDLLESVGVTRLILDPARRDGRALPRARTGLVGSFEVKTSEGTLTAMSSDPEIDALFSMRTGAISPALRAHRASTVLAAMALSAGRRPDASVVNIATDVDTDVMDAFVSSLDGRSTALVDLVSLSEAFDAARPLTTEGDPVVLPLRERQGLPGLGDSERELAQFRDLSGAQASMLPLGNDRSTEIANALNSSQHRDLSAEAIADRLSTAGQSIQAITGAVTMPRPRVVNVTSRDTVIPLRFENSSEETLSADLVLTSPQLDFPDGSERTMRLTPGVNRIEIPATVRSSGEFIIDVSLKSPDGSMTLVEGRQRVRSTAFSGVGLVLSGGALMFLVVWWYRTLRARDEDDPPSDDEVAASER